MLKKHIMVDCHGSVVRVFLISDEAKEWANNHIDSENGWQPGLPDSYILCQPRYVEDLLMRMEQDFS